MSWGEFLDCLSGYQLRLIEQDRNNYNLGHYIRHAIASTLNSKNKYPKQPLLTPKKEDKTNFTLEELTDDDNRFLEMMKKRGVKIK
jgi:hypothetical protein